MQNLKTTVICARIQITLEITQKQIAVVALGQNLFKRCYYSLAFFSDLKLCALAIRKSALKSCLKT